MITLGIIGVVAALTLPTLVDNYYKSVAEARLKKFYSVFNQAIILAEAKHGPKESWYQDVRGVEFDDEGNAITETSEVDKWFSKYLEDFMVIKKKAKNSGSMVYYLSDGSTFLLGSYNGKENLSSTRDVAFYPFGDSCSAPNYGICCFWFNFYPISNENKWKHHYKKGLEPYMFLWDGNYASLISPTGYSGCNAKNKNNAGAYCTAVVMMNGWKFPKNYPYKVRP